MMPNTKQIHYFSGLFLSLFIALHLSNQLFSLLGPSAHIEVMDQFRKIYRQPVIETILLLAVVFQVITGLKLVCNKQKKSTTEKIQVYSGLYLAMFLVAHVGAVIFGRYLHLDTSFYFAAAGLNLYPAYFIFIPYYFLAVMAITLHVAALHYLKTGSFKFAVAISIIGILVAFLIIIGYTKAFQWRAIPEAYQHFIELFF